MRRIAHMLRVFPRLRWYTRQWVQILDAWEVEDWGEAASILESFHAEKLTTNASRLYLGQAYAHLGEFARAVSEFSHVHPPKDRSEAIIYCNWFAYSLFYSGDEDGAREHARKYVQPTWSLASQEWVRSLLESSPEQPPGSDAPAKPRLLH